MPERDALIRRLNEEYIRATLESDADWFQEHLASEFACIESDGSLLDRDEFLRASAKPSDIGKYELESVNVRFYSMAALVRAHGLWTSRDGKPGRSRYVDVYALRGDCWQVVSAQVTRPKT